MTRWEARLLSCDPESIIFAITNVLFQVSLLEWIWSYSNPQSNASLILTQTTDTNTSFQAITTIVSESGIMTHKIRRESVSTVGGSHEYCSQLTVNGGGACHAMSSRRVPTA
ncbi:hypothetical protein CH63R_10879 [Colletotrichum higginsianum IMI 349063]|uniref:Uncharacterized protein n=1 Tax=Colletotrichum higginsianum (strain IMI 349063) TaxID=759273 RepID=A0A1B7Y415_COLHI|nr:uncharacterized protein CH63R_10879 [Colletotrichum higginsianum IMI 349063]OBR06759.1 hypothetical protein CH63R_10879 [Colletotrichum higginsianum IMI 349063]